jgi:nucleoside-diphosphate-sugar epimerase
VRVLITGSEGYIGPVMARTLWRAGHEVSGLDAGYFAGCTFGEPGIVIPRTQKDLRDVTSADLVGYDAVVHLAALSNDPMGDFNPELTSDINFRASVRLARAAKTAGVSHFLYASSCSVYGGAGGDAAATEDSPLDPLTPYAVSKVRSEEAISALADRHFSPVFLRNATAYGVSPRMRLDLVLNTLTAWAHTNGVVRILNDGTPWRPIVHIEDISRAFAAVLDAPRHLVHNQAFNVGITSENYQVRELAEIVAGAVPGCRIEYAGSGEPDRRSYRVDFSKIANLVPGFQPRWTARRGVLELWRAYRQYGLTADDLHGRQYIRLKQLQHLSRTGVLSDDLRVSIPLAA